MSNLPIVYTVRLDMTAEVEEESNRWNNTRHISDLLGSGFLSAVRYRSLRGEPAYLHLYELPSVALLSTEEYANVRKFDDWGPKLSHGFSNHSASLYEQVVTVNIGETATSEDRPRDPSQSWGAVRSPFLVTVRMQVPDDSADELIAWHREEHLPMLMETPGFTSGRLCRRAGLHPRTPSHDPDWIAIYEIETAEAIQHEGVKAANSTPRAQALHSVTTDARLNVLERIHPA